MKRILGIVLILVAFALGYMGFTKFQDSGKSIELLGAELSVENNEKKTNAYVLIGFSVISLIGGIYLVSQKSK